jgi:hypothetical protein
MELLTHMIKQAWRNGRVASVLFLYIEGAFPNAVKDWLLHNRRNHRVLEALVNIVDVVLTGRNTKPRFDDYLSDVIALQNGIGQGDLLSMIVYHFYNANILDLPNNKNELAVAYFDDTALFVEGPTFHDTRDTQKDDEQEARCIRMVGDPHFQIRGYEICADRLLSEERHRQTSSQITTYNQPPSPPPCPTDFLESSSIRSSFGNCKSNTQ